ncbi:hypothetical protein [Roseomonas elaeocarpi]|uniref:Tryptophan-rich sensory protein n=1 Tax=Roseomonas elaeocarpi TaxID=907779 RepID=A0ABV6JVF8_9PROT
MPIHDLRRWLCLSLPFAQILMGLLPMWGIGTSMAQVSGASQTPVIPAGYAFPVMWGVIFLLSAVYGIWQFLPAADRHPILARVGWPLAGCFALNTLWEAVAQGTGSNGFGLVVVMLLDLGCALTAFLLARRWTEDSGAVARWLVRPLTGLLAGWLTAALFANLSGAARAVGMVPAEGFTATATAVLLLLAAGGFAAGVTWASRGSPWYLGGVGWGLLAVVVANLGVNQVNIVAAIVAALMLALVVGVAWSRRKAAGVLPA